MFKIINLKKSLAVYFILLITNCALAQTGNPLWSLPNQYWPVGNPSTISLPSGGAANQYPNVAYPSSGAYNNWTMLTQDTVGPHNMMADESGKPLFFVTNGMIYNAHGYLIDSLIDTLTAFLNPPGDGFNPQLPGGYSQKQAAMGWAEICIVPKPGNCKQYYVFTAADYSSNYYYYRACDTSEGSLTSEVYAPYYALIDMSLQTPGTPSGAGELGKNLIGTSPYTGSSYPGGGHIVDLYKSTNTPSDATTGLGSCGAHTGGIQYACTKLIGGTYRFLFVTNDYDIIVYKITSTGITCLSNNNLSELPFSGGSEFSNTATPGSNLAELECYVDSANNLVNVAIEGKGVALAMASFNMTTGAMYTGIVNCIFYPNSPTYISGLEFSPDGQSLYVMSSAGLGYFTWGSPWYTDISPSIIGEFTYSQMELGKDGYLYMVGQARPFSTTTPRLARLTSPNAPSPTNFHDNIVTLTGYSCTPKGVWLGGSFPYTSTTHDSIFYLPDQIDQEIYGGNFNANTSCCLFYAPFDKFTYAAGQTTTTWTTTSTNQTWSANTTGHTNNPLAIASNLTSTVTIGEELRIPAGYTVTINNMTIKFSPQARCILENGSTTKHGGKLILSGCTLTVDNVCGLNDMWPGVQVWGTPSYAQSANFQGYLSMTNNCVIENAYVGVLAGYDTTWLSHITPRPSFYPSNPLNDPGTLMSHSITPGATTHLGGGGVVYSSGCTFLNNQRGLVFYDYANPTVYSKLYTTNFNVNAALLASGVSPRYGMGMYNMSGTGFDMYGSTFIDSHYLYADTGLFTVNTNYTLDQYASVRSTFTTLQYGIYSYNNSGSETIWCEHSTFNDNIFGIYLGLVNTATIELDTFRIHQYTPCRFCTSQPSYGLYLDVCTGYDVQDNYFTRFGTSTSNNCFGIIANNSGQHVNAIFRNTFNNIYTGSQAQFVNYIKNGTTPYNASGLLYQCNLFNGSLPRADIYVPGNTGANYGTISCPTCSLSGVQYAQGSGGSSGYPATADNTFSHTGGSAYDFFIDSIIPTATAYNSNYYYLCASSCPTSAGNLYPAKRRYIGALPAGSTTISCNSTSPYSNGYRTSASADPTVAMISQADGYKQVYDSLTAIVDGGSTTGLLLLVNGNNNHQAVLNSLTQAVPYVSDEVLKAYINSNYPASDITQVLNACSPLSDEVNSALMASNLSSGIKSQLAALQTGTSKMFALNSLKGSVFSSRHILLDKAIHTLLNNGDTTTVSLQKAQAIMRLRANELPHRARLETALELGDTAIAQQELTAVSNLEGNTNYVALYTILVANIGKAPEQFMQDQSVRSQVLAMTTDSSDRHAYLRAHVLLRSVGLDKYIPYIQQDNNTASNNNNNNVRVAATTQVEAVQIQSESTLFNQPNPFKESTTIQTHIVEKTKNAYLVITDMLGAEIARYPVQQGDNSINVNASNLQQSVMFCTLVIDGVKIKTNKMVLIK